MEATRQPVANLLVPAGELEPGDRIMVEGVESTVQGFQAFGPPGSDNHDTLAISTDAPFGTILRDRTEVVSVVFYADDVW